MGYETCATCLLDDPQQLECIEAVSLLEAVLGEPG